MAVRYCGAVKITMRYQDKTSDYRCVVSVPGKVAPYVVIVGQPRVLNHAVDSKEAYDATAHAALSFAADDRWSDFEEFVSYWSRDEVAANGNICRVDSWHIATPARRMACHASEVTR